MKTSRRLGCKSTLKSHACPMVELATELLVGVAVGVSMTSFSRLVSLWSITISLHQLSNHVRPLNTKSNIYLQSKETSHHAKHIPWTSGASRSGTTTDFPVVLPQTSREICGDAGVGARTSEGTKYIAAIAWTSNVFGSTNSTG